MTLPTHSGLRRMILRLVWASLCLLVVWWVFGDTCARYAVSPREDHGIRFAHFGTYHDYMLWRGIISDFQRDHPGQTIKQEYVLGLSGHYNTKMRQQVLSKTLPDVALVQLGPFHELASHFADLTELVEGPSCGVGAFANTLDATGMAAFRFKERQRGLPVSGGNLMIYANVECFRRAGRFHGVDIPLPSDDWTTDDFRRTARRLTCDFDGDGQIDQFGFWLPRWLYFLPFIWSFGAELTDESLSQWRLNSPEADEALSFYRDLAVDHRVCPHDEEVPQLFQDVGFLTGKVALCVNGPWFVPFLAKTRLKDSYVVAPIPRGRAGSITRVTWDGIVMADGLAPQRQSAAWKFIQFVLSAPIQNRIAQTGRALPARRESTSAFVQSPDDPRRLRFIEALPHSRLQPLLPRFGEIDRTVNEHLEQLVDPHRAETPASILERLSRHPVITSAFSNPAPTP